MHRQRVEMSARHRPCEANSLPIGGWICSGRGRPSLQFAFNSTCAETGIRFRRRWREQIPQRNAQQQPGSDQHNAGRYVFVGLLSAFVYQSGPSDQPGPHQSTDEQPFEGCTNAEVVSNKSKVENTNRNEKPFTKDFGPCAPDGLWVVPTWNVVTNHKNLHLL